MTDVILVYHILFLGLAFWINRIFFSENNPQYGISYFLGLPVLVIFLCIGNIVFSIPLTSLSRIIFGLALLGILFYISHKESCRKLIRHPVFYLLPIAWLYFYFTPEIIYRPTSWDEYARYLRRPMDMVIDNAILNPLRNGYGRGFDYTPGASLLLTYTNFLFKSEFSIGSVLAVPLISALAILGLAYDTVKSSLPKSFYIQGMLILTGVFSLFGRYLFPNHVLIEPFSIQAIIAVGLVFYFYLKKEFKTRTGLFVIGVCCAYAYLIKAPNVIFFPALFLSFYLMQVNKWRVTNISFVQFSINNFINSFFLVLPFMLVAGLWVWEMREYLPTFTRPLYDSNSINIWDSREYLMPKIWAEFISNYFSYSYSTLYFVIAFLGYMWGAVRSRHQRYFSLFIVGFTITHILLTIWFYRTMLGIYEAEQICCFTRYMSILYEPVIFFGLLFFILNSLLFLFQCKERLMFYKITPLHLKLFIFTFGCMLLALGLGSIHTTYAKVNLQPFVDISYKVEVLINELKVRNQYNSRVLVIAQGSDTREIVKILFYANQSEAIKRSISFNGGRNLGLKKENHWSIVESTSKTRDRILNSDVLWIEKTDLYIDKILEPLIDLSSCKQSFKKYFLFKNLSGKFECGVLQNPTKTSCESLYQDDRIVSGVYEIDMDGFLPLAPFKVRCKIENGKAWTLVAKISKKNTEHAQEKAIRPADFFENNKFGKFSDLIINRLAENKEFKFECGEGEFKEIYIKNHPWRSFVNSIAYKGLYSMDQKKWFPFHERGVTTWHGFDNYDAANINNHSSWFFAYHSDEVKGCYSSSNGVKSANGALWAR